MAQTGAVLNAKKRKESVSKRFFSKFVESQRVLECECGTFAKKNLPELSWRAVWCFLKQLDILYGSFPLFKNDQHDELVIENDKQTLIQVSFSKETDSGTFLQNFSTVLIMNRFKTELSLNNFLCVELTMILVTLKK